jgi:uncharacterized coiled-coil protein SlyX
MRMAASLEERVAYLEGKVEEQSRLGGDVRERLVHLDQKVDRFREELAERIEALNSRIDATNSRIDATNSRINALDQKVDRFREELAERIEVTNSRINALDQKISTQFRWLIGIMVAVLLAVIGALLRFGPQ